MDYASNGNASSGKMTSRQRLQTTLAHQQPDRVCVDFGATPVTGIHATALTRCAAPCWAMTITA